MKYLREFIKRIFLFFVLLSPVTTNAAIVTYIIEGDLQLTGGSDLFSLDGANFLYTITADTNTPMISGTQSTLWSNGYAGAAVFYNSLSASFRFTNRSNGANDADAIGSAPLLWTVNNPVASPSTDIFEMRDSTLGGEFSGLQVLTYSLNFASDFYLEDGFAPLPTQFNFNESVAAYWGRFTFSDEISEIARYEPTNWSMSVSMVPIPASVWLFISGLIGIISISKRKKVMCLT